ncbi:MAG: photosynthetic reaction center subunit H [Polynucleobacter sp.]|jgi:photosynthetic reaction center H subunit|nr:photosynthetic reaction center subunit H [Polynucleobacter sp.]
MATGAITDYLDVAQLALYAFWVFFALLVYYLTIESKREGFPLEYDSGNKVRRAAGLAGMPAPKTFRTKYDGDVTVPRDEPLERLKAQPARLNGSPIEPLTDAPLADGIGPGAYANRMDVPDRHVDGSPRIKPMRLLPGFSIAKQDTDPRGLSVVGADGVRGGSVKEVWVDSMELMIRYFEIETSAEFGGQRVMLPMNFCRVGRKNISVQAILGKQFAGVPTLKSNEQITLLEEEKVMAYYGAGTLYATPERKEPLL